MRNVRYQKLNFNSYALNTAIIASRGQSSRKDLYLQYKKLCCSQKIQKYIELQRCPDRLHSPHFAYNSDGNWGEGDTGGEDGLWSWGGGDQMISYERGAFPI